MAPDQLKRKLAAILSADVKGYSRLMGEDEEGTIRTLKVYMEAITGFIQQHRGRVVSTGGDSVLAEFASVVDAVRCAVGIQEELKDRNKELPEDWRMEFRIGVNLGDVVEEGDNILGDGVNIAARVQSLAEAGGICLSGTAYDQIKNKLAFGYEYIGEQTVKNIKEPIRVYRVLMEPEVKVTEIAAEKPAKPRLWPKMAISLGVLLIVVAASIAIWRFYLWPVPPPREVASKEKRAFPLPDKPSIAVLPFTNMSGDPKEDYLGDGIAEEIITALSKTPRLFVIARNSTFVYKGKPVSIKEVAKTLGVQYVLEGSVRKTGNKVRITAQLIDALSDHHLWAERYDRELTDIFALQDDITMKVITALRVKLTTGEMADIIAKGTKNIEAYLKLFQARESLVRMNKESNAQAKKLIEEAIRLDPGYAMAYAFLAISYFYDVIWGASQSPGESIARGIEMAQKSISLDNKISFPHGALSQLYCVKNDYDRAVSEAEIGVALEPNSALSYNFLGHALAYSSRYSEAISAFEKAIRLDPIPPYATLTGLAISLMMVDRYEEAVAIFKKVLQKVPDNLLCQLGLTATYSIMGRDADARAQAKEVLRIDPNFSMDRYSKRPPHKNKGYWNRYMDALRKAGLK
ncbi:MAG: tetratricopeptide repeat protein [Syntrophales bacterium LBB04]|nr:tetratricopeptide repeat protein [Syntrophales bacterium LBB04]